MQLPTPVTSQEYSGRVPDGTYQVIISECNYAPSKQAPMKMYLTVKMIVTGGPCHGQNIFDRFCLSAPQDNENEVRVGNARLGGLCYACGFPKGASISNTDELINRRCTCEMKTTTNKEGKEFASCNYKPAGASAPVDNYQQQTRPNITEGGYNPPSQQPQGQPSQQPYSYNTNSGWGN